MTLLLLAACSSCASRPDSVPAGAGKITAEMGPDLLTATSPDLPILPWLAVARLLQEDYRDCPLVYVNDSSIAIDAGPDDEGCLDSAGVRWRGQASAAFAAGGDISFNFEDFGPIEGVDSPWTAFGSLLVGLTDSGQGMRVESRIELTSHGPGEKKIFWIETTGGYAFYDAVFYVDHLYGTVGIGDWGTAEIDVNRVPLSVTNGCAYGSHAAGTIAMFASNDGLFTFSAASGGGDEAAAGPPAPKSSHTGGLHTGHTGAGGGGNGGGGLEVPNPMGTPSGFCGECTTMSIEGTAVPGCVVPERVVSWPFYLPF